MVDDPIPTNRAEWATKAIELYKKAAKARRLADDILVEETRERLLQYAAELEQQAADIVTELESGEAVGEEEQEGEPSLPGSREPKF